jgi:hypothetical protein
MKNSPFDKGKAGDVHSEGHIDGNGKVVGVVLKMAGLHGRTYNVVDDQLITCRSLIVLSRIVMLERKSSISDVHVEGVDGRHVEMLE